MPEDVKKDYEEAARIFIKSPRGAAALLRLGLQKLCIHLGEKGKNINDDIRSLVEKGVFSGQVVKVADTLRITGNNAVHPGQISDEDFDRAAGKMFDLINALVEETITKPKMWNNCRNQQCCLHFWLLLEDPFEQLSGIVKNVDRHGKPALFLIMPDSCLRIIQAKTKAVRRRKSVNNATISYRIIFMNRCPKTQETPQKRKIKRTCKIRRKILPLHLLKSNGGSFFISIFKNIRGRLKISDDLFYEDSKRIKLSESRIRPAQSLWQG